MQDCLFMLLSLIRFDNNKIVRLLLPKPVSVPVTHTIIVHNVKFNLISNIGIFLTDVLCVHNNIVTNCKIGALMSSMSSTSLDFPVRRQSHCFLVIQYLQTVSYNNLIYNI